MLRHHKFRPITPHNASGTNHTRSTSPANYHGLVQQRQQRANMIRQQNQALMRHHLNSKQAKRKTVEEIRQMRQQEVQYEFLSLSHLSGTERYYEAYDQLSAMLQEDKEMSLREAVFLVEQAYLG